MGMMVVLKKGTLRIRAVYTSYMPVGEFHLSAVGLKAII
jgi:hypothetical protein